MLIQGLRRVSFIVIGVIGQKWGETTKAPTLIETRTPIKRLGLTTRETRLLMSFLRDLFGNGGNDDS
jgi:hypothetical protein